MKAITNTGVYQVVKISNSFFAAFKFNDGEVLLLSKSYKKEKNAEKRLVNHCNGANVTLSK